MISCAIDGCTHQTGRHEHQGAWICSTHWRRHCPPRSARRRAYHRYFREAKRHGWGYRGKTGRQPRLDWRFWDFWKRLVRFANIAEQAGKIDMTEINKMFGFTDD